MSIEQMVLEAQKRLSAFINRSAAQHLRAMRVVNLPVPAKKKA